MYIQIDIAGESRRFRSAVQAWDWACNHRRADKATDGVTIGKQALRADELLTFNQLRSVYRNTVGPRKRHAWLAAETFLRAPIPPQPSIVGRWK